MYVVKGTWTDEIGKSLAAWYTKETGLNFSTSYVAFGYLDSSGELDTVALFTDYTGCNIELHLVGYHGLYRKLIRHICDYVFNQLNCGRLTIKLLRKDKDIEKYLFRLGFVHECVLKYYYGLHKSRDALVYRLFRHDAHNWMIP